MYIPSEKFMSLIAKSIVANFHVIFVLSEMTLSPGKSFFKP